MIRVPIFSEIFMKNKEQLSDLFQNDAFMEGIQVASPDLYQMVQEINNGDKSLDSNPKVINLLYKYAVRASSRTTAFGLFCGFCIGSFGETTAMMLSGQNKYQKRARADMEWINGIVCKLERNVSGTVVGLPGRLLRRRTERSDFINCRRI